MACQCPVSLMQKAVCLEDKERELKFMRRMLDQKLSQLRYSRYCHIQPDLKATQKLNCALKRLQCVVDKTAKLNKQIRKNKKLRPCANCDNSKDKLFEEIETMMKRYRNSNDPCFCDDKHHVGLGKIDKKGKKPKDTKSNFITNVRKKILKFCKINKNKKFKEKKIRFKKVKKDTVKKDTVKKDTERRPKETESSDVSSDVSSKQIKDKKRHLEDSEHSDDSDRTLKNEKVIKVTKPTHSTKEYTKKIIKHISKKIDSSEGSSKETIDKKSSSKKKTSEVPSKKIKTEKSSSRKEDKKSLSRKEDKKRSSKKIDSSESSKETVDKKRRSRQSTPTDDVKKKSKRRKSIRESITSSIKSTKHRAKAFSDRIDDNCDLSRFTDGPTGFCGQIMQGNPPFLMPLGPKCEKVPHRFNVRQVLKAFLMLAAVLLWSPCLSCLACLAYCCCCSLKY